MHGIAGTVHHLAARNESAYCCFAQFTTQLNPPSPNEAKKEAPSVHKQTAGSIVPTPHTPQNKNQPICWSHFRASWNNTKKENPWCYQHPLGAHSFGPFRPRARLRCVTGRRKEGLRHFTAPSARNWPPERPPCCALLSEPCLTQTPPASRPSALSSGPARFQRRIPAPLRRITWLRSLLFFSDVFCAGPSKGVALKDAHCGQHLSNRYVWSPLLIAPRSILIFLSTLPSLPLNSCPIRLLPCHRYFFCFRNTFLPWQRSYFTPDVLGHTYTEVFPQL